MPYSLNLLAPDLLHIDMHGHIDKQTAEDYLPKAWELMDNCPKPTNILTDIRRVNGCHSQSRGIIEKLKNHPNAGMYVFIVPAYLLVFAPMVKILGNVYLYGTMEEALAFLQHEAVISSQMST